MAMGGAMGKVCILIALAMCLLPVLFLVNHIVPQPYMDEVFHIPQAQEYCSGNFYKWDPMITTFPGLYLLSLVYAGILLPTAKLLGVASSLSDLCNPAVLRSLNVALVLLCSLLFFKIVRYLEPKKSERRALMKAFLLSLYPLHWFFAFLYYTDVGSTTAVMATYLTTLKGAYWISSLFAAIAVTFRQTNVVWVIFVMCAGILDILKLPVGLDVDIQADAHQHTTCSEGALWRLSTGAEGLENIRRRRVAGNAALDPVRPDIVVQQNCSDRSEFQGLMWELHSYVKLAWTRKTTLLWSFGPLSMVVLAFAVFVFLNGSIVVGAKEAHMVSAHFAQVCYFGLVAAAAMAPMHFSPRRILRVARQFRNPHSWVFALVGCTTAFLFVHYFSYAHPYLLADNRHYTFYLWKDVISAHWSSKYCLIPLYLYAWWSIQDCLGKNERKTWILVLFVGIGGVIVPAPLIEFRYYTVPIYLIALHCRMEPQHEDYLSLLLVLFYMGTNLVTMFLFLYRPFQWTHEPGVQRFIW